MDTSKIIKAVVGHGRYTTTEPVMKEDHGIILKIEGLELPASYEVDFSNSRKGGDSVTMIGDENGVLIPTQFIRDGKDVFAFLYHVGEDYGKTVYTFCIPNHVRPDRTNEQPEPEQQSTIDQAISALNTSVAKTAQDVLDVDASAQSASASASSAAQSASQAAASAQGTEEYAIRAEAAQTAAESAQSAAQTAAATATTKAAQASSAESAAASAAQSATAKAIEAAQIVEGVEGYAEAAEQSASSAQASAQTASTKASEASQSASTASAKATEAATAAGTATTAKNDAIAAKTAAQTAQAAAETAQEAAEDAAESVSGLASQIATNTADISDIKENLHDKAPVIIESASGSIASFSDGADNMPLKSLIVNIDPVQSGSGDPSPDNVRPISGWTGVTAHRADGENPHVVDDTYTVNWQSEAGTVYGGHIDVVSGVLTVDMAMVDLGTLTWDYESNYNRHGANLNQIPNTKIPEGTIVPNAICSKYKIVSSVNGWANRNTVTAMAFDATYLRIYNDGTADAETFKTALSGVQLVYELATPIVYHLSPTEVQSILGQNHVWADCGECTVEYRADTKLYIQSLTQPEEDDMIADSAITSGQFFMVGNSLYRALANIASGATITVGTNAQRVSLADALNLINS